MLWYLLLLLIIPILLFLKVPVKAHHRVNYDRIRALELEIFGKVYESGGDVHPERLFIPTGSKPKPKVNCTHPGSFRCAQVGYHTYPACKKCYSLNAQYHEEWCPTNERISHDRSDPSDTYAITEGMDSDRNW